MRKILALVMIMLMVSIFGFALDIGGSTALAGIGNVEDQKFELDQVVDIDLGIFHFDVDGGLDYKLPEKDWLWDYAVGASGTFSVFTLGGSIAGNQGVKLDALKAYLDIAVAPVGADIDFLFSANEAKDIFQGAEFSAFYNPGPFEFRIGYLWTENGAGEVNAPEVFTNGGIYGKAKINY